MIIGKIRVGVEKKMKSKRSTNNSGKDKEKEDTIDFDLDSMDLMIHPSLTWTQDKSILEEHPR